MFNEKFFLEMFEYEHFAKGYDSAIFVTDKRS